LLVELIEWVGRLGRRGGVVLLALSALVIAANRLLWSQRLPGPDGETVFYAPLLWILAGVFGVTGLYLLLTGGVWRGDTRFSPLDDEALRAAIETQATPFCVCAQCRVVLPYEVSVGRCPRCNGKSNCVEIFNFSDRKLALDLATLEPSADFELRPLRAEYVGLMRTPVSDAELKDRLAAVEARLPGHDAKWYLTWLLDDLRRAKR
jgi:hypothetical protein